MSKTSIKNTPFNETWYNYAHLDDLTYQCDDHGLGHNCKVYMRASGFEGNYCIIVQDNSKKRKTNSYIVYNCSCRIK